MCLLFFTLLCFSCSSDGNRRDRRDRRDRGRDSRSTATVSEENNSDYVRVKGIDGTKLTLSNERDVTLIGVENTPEAESFLRRHLESGIKVRYVFDSQNTPRRPDKQMRFHAYVLDEDGENLSALLLKNKVTGIKRDKYLRDSLFFFKEYFASDYQEKKNFPVASVRNASFHVRTYKNGFGTGTGSGFYVSADGIGMSNYHVFEGGDYFTVSSCEDGTTYKVSEILAYSEQKDYIIFRVEGLPTSVDYLEVSDKTPEQGDEIYVYGNPKGLDCVLSNGIISALREENRGKTIQITAPISPGNSGSPVTNANGDLLGIATFKRMECENCNFAMSAEVMTSDLYRFIDR